MIGLSGEIPLVSHSDVTSPFPPSGNGGYASNRDVLQWKFLQGKTINNGNIIFDLLGINHCPQLQCINHAKSKLESKAKYIADGFV